MTRISSYGLYQCSACLQVHIKANYGSISVHVPREVFSQDSDVVTCKSCGIRKPIASFRYLGMRSKQNSLKSNVFERIAIELGWKSKPDELDVRKLYPKLLD